MSIQFNKQTYKIKILEESCTETDHSLITPQNLPTEIEFTGEELFKIIAITGLLPCEVIRMNSNPNFRRDEIHWKSEMIRWILSADKSGYLYINSKTRRYLESSEVRNIDFWLGMYFTALVAKKLYPLNVPSNAKYEYIIHYSNFIASKLANANPVNTISNLRPDFIAKCKGHNIFGVFEAKGRMASRIDKTTMEHAFQQAAAITSIGTATKLDRIVSYSLLDKSVIHVQVKDPPDNNNELDPSQENQENTPKDKKPEKESLSFDFYSAMIWQYMPLIDYFEECETHPGPDAEVIRDNESISCISGITSGIRGLSINNDFYNAVNDVRKIVIENKFLDKKVDEITKKAKVVKELIEREDVGVGFEIISAD